jgi:chromosome segregation ATPase
LSTLAKVLSFFVLILAVVLTVASATLFTQQQNYKSMHDTVKQQVDDANQAAAVAKKEADDAKGKLRNAEEARDRIESTYQEEIAKLEAESKERDQKIADLEAKVAEALAALARVPEQLKVYVDRTSKLEATVEEKNVLIEGILSDKREAQKALSEAQNQNSQLTAQVSKLSAYVSELEDTVARLTSKQPRKPSASSTAAELRTPDGTVLAVKGGDVSLSIGTRDNVDVGYEYDVFRGGSLVGEVKVVSVKDASSVARIVDGAGNIREGDDVSNRYK